MRFILLTLIIFSAVMVLYIIAENNFVLMIRREKLGNGVRIMHISDIHKRHFGGNNCRIAEIAEKESPDLIFITGDLVSRTEDDFIGTAELLKRLCAAAPVYFVSGNHEQSLLHGNDVPFAEMMRKTPVHWLTDQCTETIVNGRKLNICGVCQKYTTYKKNGHYRDLDVFTLEEMRSAMTRPDGEVLLLAHNPLWGEIYSQWGADYTFSGHVHGGIVRIFGIGLFSPERKFLPAYSKGIYDIGGMKLLVSGGLGKLRAFNPPEIVIYEL